MQLLILFLSMTMIQTLEYDIDNEQICTHRPFKTDFHHNCSRTRLIQNISVPNTDEIIYISIILEPTSSMNTTLNITKSSRYNQKIYFTFLTFNQQYMYITNRTILTLSNTTINSYLYDTLSEQFIQIINPYLIPLAILLTNPYCILKQTSFLPPSDISRIYYLYTNETNLNFDFSISTSHISPLFNRFETCFAVITSLTVLAIVLIVIICILCFVTLVLVSICLKRQLIQLYHLWKNWWNNKHDMIPEQTIVG